MYDPRDALTFDPVGAHNDSLNISTAQTLTRPATADKLMLQCITQNARYTLDGTTPTSAIGFLLVASNDPIILWIGQGATVTIIEAAATAELEFQWGK